jgi:hypothetical protein
VVTQALTATPDALHGLVRLSAAGVPNGAVRVTRTATRTPEEIRGGVFTVTTGGFFRSDPEVPFGTDLTYRVTDTVVNRAIQTNRVLNPKAALNVNNWTAGANRSLGRETGVAMRPPRDATTSLQIGQNPAGTTAVDIPARTLAYTTPSGFGTGRWFVSGQLFYDSPDLWLWQDVKAAGTWQTIKNKGTWQAVKSSSSELANQPFASLWAAVLSPVGTVVVAPFQVLGVQAVGGNQWHTFSAWVDVPANAPAGSRLVFLQGTATREYAVTWWLTTVMVTPEAEMTDGAVTPYFDGDSAVPFNPAANMVPGYDWLPLTGDASMGWNGTANGSVSVFTGPSVIYAETTSRVNRPSTVELPKARLPVYLSDPVAPQLGQWFELLEIGDLTAAARAALYDILSRAPQIAVSQLRAWPSGELRLMTYTADQASIAERLFASGRILYFRNPDPRFPESSWYTHIGDVTWGRVHPQMAWRPERIWRIPFVRVERPEGLIAASTSITWADVKNGYSWDTLRRQREDWLDVGLTAAGS